MIDSPQLTSLIVGSVGLAMPLVFAATGELISERAGVLNLSLEGMMLSGAFAGVVGSWATGNPVIGVMVAAFVGIAFGVVQAIFSITLRANQLVVGIGFNILILGATTFLNREIFGALSRTEIPGFLPLHIPFFSDLPLIGGLLFQYPALTYIGLILVCVTWWILDRSAWGLSVKATGENPRSADEAGLNVRMVRYCSVIYASLMAALGGAYLSLVSIHTFTENMTNGAGYLAITAVIFGGWNIWPTLGACLLFGIATNLQFVGPSIGLNIPVAIFMMLPYVLALLAIGGVVNKARMPAALTIPFMRGR